MLSAPRSLSRTCCCLLTTMAAAGDLEVCCGAVERAWLTRDGTNWCVWFRVSDQLIIHQTVSGVKVFFNESGYCQPLLDFFFIRWFLLVRVMQRCVVLEISTARCECNQLPETRCPQPPSSGSCWTQPEIHSVGWGKGREIKNGISEEKGDIRYGNIR